MPTISVIIPAYNAERTILETIASVQEQTFSDFELIVINDGSTDRTLGLLDAVQDPRIRVFSYKNGGVAIARNRGISHAIGDLIAFLDADDLWTSDKLELQLAALQQHPEAGVAYSWTTLMDEKGESFLECEPTFYEGNVYAQLLVRCFLDNGSNSLVRRQAIESVGEFDPALPPCEDWDFWLRLAARWSFVVVQKHQIFYRQSSRSASANFKRMEKQNLLAIEKAFQSAPKELQYLKSQSLATVYQHLAEKCLAHATNADDLKLAGHMLQMLIRAYPQALLDKKARSLVKWFIKLWILMRLPSRTGETLSKIQYLQKT